MCPSPRQVLRTFGLALCTRRRTGFHRTGGYLQGIVAMGLRRTIGPICGHIRNAPARAARLFDDRGRCPPCSHFLMPPTQGHCPGCSAGCAIDQRHGGQIAGQGLNWLLVGASVHFWPHALRIAAVRQCLRSTHRLWPNSAFCCANSTSVRLQQLRLANCEQSQRSLGTLPRPSRSQ